MGKQATIDPGTVSGQLRMAIRDSGKTLLAISEASGVEAGVIRLITGNQIAKPGDGGRIGGRAGIAFEQSGSGRRRGTSSTPRIAFSYAGTASRAQKDDDAYLAWLDTLDEW